MLHSQKMTGNKSRNDDAKLTLGTPPQFCQHCHSPTASSARLLETVSPPPPAQLHPTNQSCLHLGKGHMYNTSICAADICHGNMYKCVQGGATYRAPSHVQLKYVIAA